MSMHHALTVLAFSMSQQVRNRVILALFLTKRVNRCLIWEISETCLCKFPSLFRRKRKAMLNPLYLLMELMLMNLMTDLFMLDIFRQLVLEILVAPFTLWSWRRMLSGW